ncbi:MAG: hypothetical protein AAFO94_06030 [Bacteroidota bacterium]
MKKFSFQSNIIKRRKLRKSALLTGLLAAGVLGYGLSSYLQMGSIPIIDKLARQIGLTDYMPWVYLSVLGLLIFLIIPAIRTILKKKTVVGGQIRFDEQNLNIIDGKEKYVIPEEKIPQLHFELKALPAEGPTNDSDALFGGSWMKIPTSRGTQSYELDINNKAQQEELMEMIEFLKIEHDVKIKVREIK